MNEDFSSWLNALLNDRGWSRSEAARRGGISASMFDKVITGNAQPGLDFLRGIHRAFGLSLEEVMRQAGILPAVGELPEGWLELGHRLMRLSAEDRAEVVRDAESIVGMAERWALRSAGRGRQGA